MAKLSLSMKMTLLISPTKSTNELLIMCIMSHRDYFTSYIVEDFRHVKIGNQGVNKVVGIGEIWLDNTSCKLHLKNARHSLNIRLNLISIHVLDEDDYHNSFGDGKWK